jgi:hypothetical protein
MYTIATQKFEGTYPAGKSRLTFFVARENSVVFRLHAGSVTIRTRKNNLMYNYIGKGKAVPLQA